VAEAGPRNMLVSNGWEIDLARRELRSGGAPVPIGSRAFEILEVLARSGGELISKYGLMEQVWPGAIVEENTLQFHISAIRKALGADRGMLKTVTGRGYRLIGRWDGAAASEPERAVGVPGRMPGQPFRTNVPIAASPLIGRDALRQHLVDLLTAYRVVTLTGPGGIGKSVLALETARRIFSTYEGDCWLVELASLSDAALVPAAVTVVLGLRIDGKEISAESVARALGRAKLLLVLDNCEHLVEAAARLAETIVRMCPNVSVLATSRETLRIEGEYACRVPPLDVPPPGEEDQAVIDSYSAVALFNARLMALGAAPPTRAEDPALVSAICRRLDGIPLAIEFAAARASTLGLRQTADLLSDRLGLLTSGRRMALPRHQTLRAALDWSYELLPEFERTLLCRVAVCAGGFTLEAATAVVGDSTATTIADGIASLAAKSLVSLDASAPSGRWRLLESIRAYALDKLAKSGGADEAARRHAAFFRDLFAPAAQRPFLDLRDLPRYVRDIDNMRAALEWAFASGGENVEIGTGLAAGAAPVLMATSMLPECHRWSSQALSVLDDGIRGGAEEMRLQAGLGFSLLFMQGLSDAALAALDRSLGIAEAHADVLYQMSLLACLNILHIRNGNVGPALQYARRSFAVANGSGDDDAMALAHFLLGDALHIVGDLGGARVELEAALQPRARTPPTCTTYLGFDQYLLARIYLANTLGLQGYIGQAVEQARETVEDAWAMHPIALSIVLRQAILLFLWIGDTSAAEEHIDWYAANAQSHSLGPQVVVGRALRGELAIRRGDAERGVEILRDCADGLRTVRYRMMEFDVWLAEGLAATGRVVECLRLIDDRIRQGEANGDAIYLPELLRLKGALLAQSPATIDQAEMSLNQSLERSRQQGARVWELRAAIDLAKLLTAQERREDAQGLLAPVLKWFAESPTTEDLRAAERLLATLR
jgi:predicted ATPase/DNA-binding winged helix-turn-helix (wHTH) protein